MTNNIVIASDHAGFALKEKIKEYFNTQYNFTDLGTNSEDSVDYPDFAAKMAEFMLKNPNYRGILLCGSGIGISIAANRHKHIRAALCHNETTAELSRLHNDANILVMGARIVNETEAFSITDRFLGTEFAAGRHQLRVTKLS